MIIPCTRAQDWEVLQAVPSMTSDGVHVRGINHNYAEGSHGRVFYWTLDRFSASNERYDWSGCVFAAGARERLERLQEVAA